MKALSGLKNKISAINLPALSPALRDELEDKGWSTLADEAVTLITGCFVIFVLFVIMGSL